MSDSDHDDWIFDPNKAAIDRAIRHGFRQEAMELESDVHDFELRERFASDVFADMHNRDDRVTVATSRRSFSGHVVYTARDFLTLRTESFEVDIHYNAIVYVKVVERGTRGGKARNKGPGTFELRLMERRSPIDRVEVGYRSVETTVIGNVVAVGQDHVLLLDDHQDEWVIPLVAMAWVIRRTRRRALV